MRTTTKRLLAIALTAALLVGLLAFSAFADGNEPTVIFDAQTNTFSFKNVDFTTRTDSSGNKQQSIYPDLFPDLKDMMPGDTVSQTIRFEVRHTDGKTVKLMLKAEEPFGQPPVELDEKSGWSAEPAAEGTEAADPTNSDYAKLFAAGERDTPAATLTALVEETGNIYSGTLTLLSGDASKDTDGVYLGAFSGSNSGRNVTVSFSLPLEAGNELMGLTAKLGWVITADVISNGGGGEETTPELNTVDHYAYIIGRDDGLVHPEAQITRAEVATIFFRMLTDASRSKYWSTENAYPDVAPNDWFNAAVSTMSNAGILQGYPDGSFRPNDPITRAEFAVMAARFFSGSHAGTDHFSDIENHWACEYINNAAEAGLIEGYGDGTFRPDRAISRAEAITLMNRVLKRCPSKDHLLEEMIRWPDNMDPDAWYYAAIQEATNSHDYRLADGNDPHEVWIRLLPVRDWAAFETEWATSNAASNPGEVISSAKAVN